MVRGGPPNICIRPPLRFPSPPTKAAPQAIGQKYRYPNPYFVRDIRRPPPQASPLPQRRSRRRQYRLKVSIPQSILRPKVSILQSILRTIENIFDRLSRP